MSLAQVKTVQRAQKDQGACSSCGVALPDGSAYRYWKPGFRSRVKIRRCMKPECTPKRSELESSKLADAYSAIEDAETKIDEASCVTDVQEALDELASAIEGVAGEYEDSVQQAPMLEDQLREKIDQLEDFASEVSGTSLETEPEDFVAPDEPERSQFDGDETFNEAHDAWLATIEQFETDVEEHHSACEEALVTAKEEAHDVLERAEF